MTETALKDTPFSDRLRKQGASEFTDWGGYAAPLQYTDAVEEHRAVREAAALFDFTPLAKFEIKGSGSAEAIQYLVTNDFASAQPGRVIYTAMCKADGGIMDDCTVFKGEGQVHQIVSGTRNDLDWITEVCSEKGAQVSDQSEQWCNLSLQGPKSRDILRKLTSENLDNLAYYHHIPHEVDIAGARGYLSRTGYSGELGYELFVHPPDAGKLFDAVWEAGQPFGLKMAGYNALDSIRVEYGLLYYGFDMDQSNNPYETGLGWVVKLDKGPFMGSEALKVIKQQGVDRRFVSYQLNGDEVAEGSSTTYQKDEPVGHLTSPNYGHTVKKSLSLGYARSDVPFGTQVEVGEARRAATVNPSRTYDPAKQRVLM